MSDPRTEIEDLAALSQLPPDDPRRMALEAHPGVRARLRAYEEFMAPGDLPPAGKMAEAEERLAAMLEREIGVKLEPPATPRGVARDPGPAGSGAGPSWFARLLSPPLRPLFATAAVLVVVAGAWLAFAPRAPDEAPVYRGGEPPAAPGAWDARLAAEPVAGAGTRLSWAPFRGADAYTVVFLSGDLAEIARVSGLPGPELVLARGALPAGLAPGAEVLWRVVATRGTDQLAQSPTAPLTLP